jgi:O-antigen/teichoic acid export membrane protein
MMGTNNKTIAKNTLLLYFRMVVTMIISLYTSRVVLQILGVDDFGIYQAVGGIVGFLSFINNALATGSSRFLTYGLGEGNLEKLKKVFSTVLTAHIGLALIIVVIAETAGLWFLYNKLVIPEGRLEAAIYTFHISILTAFFTLTQIPYNATIIAHEKMNIYAYMSIVDAVLKLLIVYMLAIGGIDKLKLYATLLCFLQVGIMTFYRLYCSKRFQEAKFRIYFEKKIFCEIAAFSGWSLFAQTSIALNNQGVLLLLNMFFSPAVVAARAISIQVNMHAHQLVSNFQTAAVPQIVKRYAAKDYEGSKNLLLLTCKFSYYLMLCISLPVCLVAKDLLNLWLGVVPNYTVIFLQIIIVQTLFQIFDTTFYYALYAKGQLRENALISPTLGFIQFPIVYFLFKNGYSPVALSWASFIVYAILGFIVKPILVTKIVNYKWSDIFSTYYPCFKVTIGSLPIPLVVYFLVSDFQSPFLTILIISIFSVASVMCSCWIFGLSTSEKIKLVEVIRSKWCLFTK